MESGVATRPIADFDAYQRRPRTLRVPLRPAHAPGVRGRARNRRSASSMPRARTSACCARCRPWSTSSIARPILIGNRADDRASACARWACACDLGAASVPRCSTRADDRRRRSTRWSRPTSAWSAAAACRPTRRPGGMRSRPTVAAAMLLHAGHGGRGALRRHRRLVAPHRLRAADHPAARPASARIYALSALILQGGALFFCDTHMNARPDRRADRRDDAARGRGGAPVRHRAEGGAAVAFQLRRQQFALRAQDARTPCADPRSARPSSRSMARCTPTPRSPRRIRDRAVPDSRLDGHREPADHADARCRQYRLQPAEGGGRRAAGRPAAARHVEAASTCWCRASRRAASSISARSPGSARRRSWQPTGDPLARPRGRLPVPPARGGRGLLARAYPHDRSRCSPGSPRSAGSRSARSC